MGSEILIVSLAAIITGAIVAYLFREKIRKFSKSEREKNKIINDPDLLLEKLNKNGEMVDLGEKLEYSVTEKDGERQLSLKKTPYKDPKLPGRKDGKKK